MQCKPNSCILIIFLYAARWCVVWNSVLCALYILSSFTRKNQMISFFPFNGYLCWKFENICGSKFRIEFVWDSLKCSHNLTTCSVHRKTSQNLFAFLHNQHMSNFPQSHFLARFGCFAHSLSRTHTLLEKRSHSHMHTYACTRRSHLCVKAYIFWMYRHDFRNLFFRTFSVRNSCVTCKCIIHMEIVSCRCLHKQIFYRWKC